jgi:hypothetical protein
MKTNNISANGFLQKLERIGACFCAVLFSGLVSIYAFLSLYKASAKLPTAFGHGLSSLATHIGLSTSIVRVLEVIQAQQLIILSIVFIALMYIALSMIFGKSKFIRFCYRKRYWIALVILSVSIILKLNGTSLSCWSNFLNGADQYKPIWGSAREVRSDEWAVWSAFTISQGFSGWPAISPAIAGGNVSTLWVSVGGIPALNLALIFKPMYLGFPLLGTERGFSFLWTLRPLLLFLVSFEFAMRYIEKKTWLSFCAAMVITFAPYVQWWSSQSVAEVLIFAQGILLCLDSYINSSSRKARILISVLLAYCIGCYVMIAHVSWLISTFYVVLAIAIVIFLRNRKRLTRADIPTLLLPVVIVVGYLSIIVLSDMTTLNLVRNSVYPGNRLITGGGFFQSANYFTGLYSLLLPFVPAPFSNSCELSGFLTFAPAGLILACYSFITTRKKDPLSIALISIELFFLYFLIVGVPAVVAKATLLFECNRMNIALGLADIILLFRGLSRSKAMPIPLAITSTLVSAALNVLMLFKFYPVPKLVLIGFIVLYILLFYMIYRHQYDHAVRKKILIFALSCVMLSAGAFVNPIQQGIQCVTETNLVKTLTSIQNTSDDVYLVEGNWPLTNVPLLAGKNCFDSTQVYPDPEKWRTVDPSGQYETIYNRFSHISLNLITDQTRFRLQSGDLIVVDFCVDDLKVYNIRYLMTQKDYSSLSGYKFALVGVADDWNVYQITYPTAAKETGD